MSENGIETLDINPFPVVCRGCLSENGEMKNIYEWGLSEDFYKFADVLDSRVEGVSELLCSSCEETLQSCSSFRARCQRSDQLLREMGKKRDATRDALQIQDLNQGHKIEISTFTDSQLTICITSADMQNKILLPCPFKCQKDFLKQRDLVLHLVKTHGMNQQCFVVDVQYYCPFIDCHHHRESLRQKPFQGRKYLNQHLNKVHMSKFYSCHSCKVRFSTEGEYHRHSKTCNVTYVCAVCNTKYTNNERLLVHLKRKHPELHQHYKEQRKNDRNYLKRIAETVTMEVKKQKSEQMKEYICDSPKRSFATQTIMPDIKNDVSLGWAKSFDKSEEDRNFSTIETQTVFEDLLSLKSQNCEEDSIFFSETVSLSDIQTQTFPIEFGLSRKETNTSETQTKLPSPDLSIKETQTCNCHYDSPKVNFKLFDSANCSPSHSFIAVETQTPEFCKSTVKSDVMLGYSSAETQTCFEERKMGSKL